MPTFMYTKIQDYLNYVIDTCDYNGFDRLNTLSINIFNK